ncbi:MAG: cell envelope integrity protein TolA [Gammaproteobacteria bacterium]|nr:cell envelope integrity protein TolA [Gammaproteobacteria bacterium]
MDEEAARLAEERAEAATASFVAAIVGRIERNWSRPPSARNGMRAELRIGLVPTGEVVSVDIIESSGNAAFDRSAQTAVRRAAPFEVPDDPGLFERQFRSLRILFHPEDLRK